jgi:hypothetical protein
MNSSESLEVFKLRVENDLLKMNYIDNKLKVLESYTWELPIIDYNNMFNTIITITALMLSWISIIYTNMQSKDYWSLLLIINIILWFGIAYIIKWILSEYKTRDELTSSKFDYLRNEKFGLLKLKENKSINQIILKWFSK